MAVRHPIAAAAALSLAGCQTAVAPAAVDRCQALTLYGNAAASGLCRSLSPTSQTLWVCELASSPDVHTTFNGSTNLHITVRMQGCEGYSNLDGAWPGQLRLAGQPMICGVNVQNYGDRLNAQPRMPARPGMTFVRTAFVTAIERSRLAPALAQGYIDLGVQWNCA